MAQFRIPPLTIAVGGLATEATLLQVLADTTDILADTTAVKTNTDALVLSNQDTANNTLGIRSDTTAILADTAVIETNTTNIDTKIGAALDTNKFRTSIVDPIPAGTNNIGDVDVTNLPATVDTNSGNHTANTIRVVVSSNQPVISVQSQNFPASVATNTGAANNNTIRVVLADDTPATPSVVLGNNYVTSVNRDLTANNITNGSWVELVASLPADVYSITLFMSNGNPIELGIGAAASETRLLLVPPGGFDTPIQLAIPSGSRVSARAISSSLTSGALIINFLGA